MPNSITRHIPNSVTCLNLFSGCIACVMAFEARYEWAFFFIILSAVFDFFDGMLARLLHAYSNIGKDLDSLADDVSFGVAPSVMVFSLLHEMCQPATGVLAWLPYVAFLIAVFSALRLAKFNNDSRQTTSFIGLPVPANALFWASLTVGAGSFIESSPYMIIVVLALILLSCFIMVAELPMFALKFKQWGWKDNEVKYIFIASCVPLIAIFRISAFALIVAWYVLLSVYVNKKHNRR